MKYNISCYNQRSAIDSTLKCLGGQLVDSVSPEAGVIYHSFSVATATNRTDYVLGFWGLLVSVKKCFNSIFN